MASHAQRRRMFVILFVIVLIAFSLFITAYMVLSKDLNSRSSSSGAKSTQQGHRISTPTPTPTSGNPPKQNPGNPIDVGDERAESAINTMAAAEEESPQVTKNMVGRSAWTLLHAITTNSRFAPLVQLENSRQKTVSEPNPGTTIATAAAKTTTVPTPTATPTTVLTQDTLRSIQPDEDDVFREARKRIKLELKSIRERSTTEKFMILFELVGDLFPCSYCNTHFRSMMNEAEEDTMIAALWGEGVLEEAKRRISTSGADQDNGNTDATVATIMNERASQWICKVHNIVNKRVHNEEFVCKADALHDRWRMSCDDGKCTARP